MQYTTTPEGHSSTFMDVTFSNQEPINSAPSTSGSNCEASTGYLKYINLLDDNEPEYDRKYSPTPPPLSPLTPDDVSNVTLEALLTCHRTNVLSEERFRVVVRRKFIFEDTLHSLRNGLDVSKRLRVTFVGEPAIDDGWPMREYLRLLLGAVISNNSLFCGDVNSRYLQHNVLELNKKTYYHVGQILSMSLLHVGPMPSFFAQPIADYIVHGIEKVKVGITDVQDVAIKRKLQKLKDADTIEHFRQLLDSCEFHFRHECGISKPSANIRETDRDSIVSSICLHFVVLATKAELDQLVNGLNALGVLPLVRDNPTLGRQLFVQGSPKELTEMVLYDMLPADLSPPMSNGRDKGEAQLMNWLNFLHFVEGSNGVVTFFSPEPESEEHQVPITLSDVLAFGIGAVCEPPMGFYPKPKVAFCDRNRYLTANTCTNTIYLLRESMSYDDFNYYASFSIGNRVGFGQL